MKIEKNALKFEYISEYLLKKMKNSWNVTQKLLYLFHIGLTHLFSGIICKITLWTFHQLIRHIVYGLVSYELSVIGTTVTIADVERKPTMFLRSIDFVANLFLSRRIHVFSNNSTKMLTDNTCNSDRCIRWNYVSVFQIVCDDFVDRLICLF